VRYPVRFYLLHPGTVTDPADFKAAHTTEHVYVLGTLPEVRNAKAQDGTFLEAGLIARDSTIPAGEFIAQIHNPLAAANENFAVLELNAKR
jgi:hypothetical protein